MDSVTKRYRVTVTVHEVIDRPIGMPAKVLVEGGVQEFTLSRLEIARVNHGGDTLLARLLESSINQLFKFVLPAVERNAKE